ncbi:MAG TPA: hypothetical protein PKX38_09545 [Alphaproteobacteria bacterium]|nr:hypothetical protein [Alphaproteobacteria bacterium]
MRIYTVNTPTGKRYVEAGTKGAAINHCVGSDYSAEPTSSSELYAHMQAQGKVEKAEGKKSAGETKPPSGLTSSAPSAPQPPAQPSSPAPIGATPAHNPAPAAFAPPAAPGVNPVLAEQQAINPKAAAAAGAPAPILPPPGAAAAPAPGPVDWEAREQG